MVAPSVGAAELGERLAAIRGRIAAAAPDPAAVTLVAVTKGFGPEAVRMARHAGLVDVGENYADELVAKAADLAGAAGASPAAGQAPLRWHYLGAIQRNKVARLAPWVGCWQGVARIEEGRAIARRAPGAQVLVQVDVAGMPGRGGADPGDVPGLVAGLRGEDLDVAGLMAVGPPGPPEAARPGFLLVGRLADDLGLPVRSMGMTDDLEVALEAGSTMVRLGRALFGPRPPRVPG
jgi:PLP dependent protein